MKYKNIRAYEVTQSNNKIEYNLTQQTLHILPTMNPTHFLIKLREGFTLANVLPVLNTNKPYKCSWLCAHPSLKQQTFYIPQNRSFRNTPTETEFFNAYSNMNPPEKTLYQSYVTIPPIGINISALVKTLNQTQGVEYAQVDTINALV